MSALLVIFSLYQNEHLAADFFIEHLTSSIVLFFSSNIRLIGKTEIFIN